MDRLVTTPIPPVRPWQPATVIAVRQETPNAKTFHLQVAGPHDFVAGQHFILRLTSDDGYHAQRAYSAASPPGWEPLEVTVERLPGGEVSTFLHDAVQAGDTVDIRGPIGGHFAWDVSTPILGVAGGSGIAPLMSMLRAARTTGRPADMTLVVSVRSASDLYYGNELTGPNVHVVYTRTSPPDDARGIGRLTVADLAPLVRVGQPAFVCGSPAFCDAVTMQLDSLDVPARDIRVERFGPSG